MLAKILAIFIPQIYQQFWLYKGFLTSLLNFIFLLQIYQEFWLYKGFWALKMNFISIPKKSTCNFGSTRGSWLPCWISFSFYKSMNNFGSTRGWNLFSFCTNFGSKRVLDFIVEFYIHSTNLPPISALQGGLGLEIEFYFYSTILPTGLALQRASKLISFSFYKYTNNFGSTKGFWLRNWI